MPNYLPYRDDLETLASNEAQTRAKIIELMTNGMNTVREKHGGKAVRISYAKAHVLVKGELRVLGQAYRSQTWSAAIFCASTSA